MNLFAKLLEYNEHKIPVMMVTVVSKKGDSPVDVGKKMIVAANGEAFGTVGGGALEYAAREKCKELLKSNSCSLQKYVLNEGKVVENATTLPMICGGVVELFFEYVGASAYVTIFGGGHCGQALTKVLKTMDYHVTVVENRPEVYEQIVGADRKVKMNYAEFIETEGLMEGSYAVIMTPSHKYDYNVMHKVLHKKLEPKYIGMLCSREKLEDFLQVTYEEFGDNVDLSNFYSPIGLDTGGGSPQEIAVAIAAEMLTVKYKKEGHKHLRDDSSKESN